MIITRFYFYNYANKFQIDEQSRANKFEQEIKEEQEEKRKEEEEKKTRRAAFKEKATFFANVS